MCLVATALALGSAMLADQPSPVATRDRRHAKAREYLQSGPDISSVK